MSRARGPARSVSDRRAIVGGGRPVGGCDGPDMILPPRAAPAKPEPSPDTEPAAEPVEVTSEVSHWLLSLFAPAAEDAVDWARGNYSVIPRGGRVDSPVRRGDLKKQVN